MSCLFTQSCEVSKDQEIQLSPHAGLGMAGVGAGDGHSLYLPNESMTHSAALEPLTVWTQYLRILSHTVCSVLGLASAQIPQDLLE